MSVGSTQKSILLFDYADNGNYTTVLKSQVSCEYKPNGTGAARTAYIKNLGWHFARYGGVTNLWETLNYKVSEVRVISPNDVEAILIQPGHELLTLLTCHPPASGGKQRYLVLCERTYL